MKRGAFYLFYLLMVISIWIQNHDFCYAGINNPNLSKEQAVKWMKSHPVQFLENKGQMTDMNHKPVPQVLFKAEAQGMNLYLTETGLTYVFVKTEQKLPPQNFDQKNGGPLFDKMRMPENEKRKTEWNRIDLCLEGAKISRNNIIRESASKDFKQYFLGHCPDGITDVHAYEKITIKDVYPNIDWVFYNSTEKGFKYDFIVHPGASTKQIEMVYASMNPLAIDENGNLQIETALGNLTENAPESFVGGEKIASSFVKTMSKKNERDGFDTHIKFLIGGEDDKILNEDLVIDPQLVWGTFFGGSQNENVGSICTDVYGDLFITGSTNSTDFPLFDSGNYYQGEFSIEYLSLAYILKFSKEGILTWATYYGGYETYFEGGVAYNDAHDLATDSYGNIFVTGISNCIDFPIYDGGSFFQEHLNSNIYTYDYNDVFILKFTNTGIRLWATYYGGSNSEWGYCSIAVDFSNNIFVSGVTNSADFPTQDAGTFFQNSIAEIDHPDHLRADAFILKFDNFGNRLWATYYGGCYDADGFIYGYYEIPVSVSTDLYGNVIILGHTNTKNFPTQDNGTFFQDSLSESLYEQFDLFILKFDNLGNRIWSTFYGGFYDEYGGDSKTDANGNIFIVGSTNSINFPIQNNGNFYQDTIGGQGDAFLLKFDNEGNRMWGTLFGGNGYEAASINSLDIDNFGDIFLGISVYNQYDSINPQNTTINLCDGGFFSDSYNGGQGDYQILKFNNFGSLLWSSYLGGNGSDYGSKITLDDENNLYFNGLVFDYSLDLSTYDLVNQENGAYFDGLVNGDYNYELYIAKFQNFPFLITQNSTDITCESCTGSATIIPTGSCNYTYLWSNGDTNQTATSLCAGNYFVIVSDENGVVFVDSIEVIELNVFIETMPDTLCEETEIELLSSAIGGTPQYNFLWSTSPTDTLSNFTTILNQSGYVTLTITDENNCMARDSLYITIVPQLSINVTNDTCICFGESIDLKATGAPSFLWSTGDTTSTISVNPEINSTYIATYHDGVCELTIDSTTVCVNPNPVLSIMQDTSVAYNSSIALEATGEGIFYWSPANTLSCNTCTAPIASPIEDTIYMVTLTNQFGCNTSESVSVELYYYAIVIPNIITPNGDGMNDFFNISGLPNNSTITIFNRWGNELYNSNSYQNNWAVETNGVYFYILYTPDGKYYNGYFQVN
jgi:gliding motility-associated-like protein